MNDTPYVGAFPPYLMVSDVATAGSPHQGLGVGAAWAAEHGSWANQTNCPGNCTEVYQMQVDNPLMQNLNSTSFRSGFGRNPQGAGGTDWTNLASNNDEVLSNFCTVNNDTRGAPSNVSNTAACGWMPGATHFVDYPGSYPNYCHGCYLTDTNTTWNATEVFSDNNGGSWASVNNSEHSVFTMYDAILYSNW